MSDISITVQDGTPVDLTLATGVTLNTTITPKALGTAAVGSTGTAAQADHVHPIGNVVGLIVALG